MPRVDGRTRYAQMERLRAAVDAAVGAILGDRPRVQVVLVDLTASDPLQFTPLPTRIKRQTLLHRERAKVAGSNLDVALRQFTAETDRCRVVEDARSAASDLSAGLA